MSEFPRTMIENLSVPRLIAGTNWWLGWSHTSAARDRLIRETMAPRRIADVLEVFLKAGVDAVLGVIPEPRCLDGLREAEQRAGRRLIRIGTPTLEVADTPAAYEESARMLDTMAEIGVHICMPHQQSTDALVDRVNRRITRMEKYVAMIRERGMIAGLSTHMPETPTYADQQGLDVATYIQIYNAAGFLMQVEVDWVHRIIWKAKKPVMTIKPLAAGRLLPLVGLGFAWATLREQDMVAVGTFSPDEAREVVEISLSILERRVETVELQTTRSKASLR